MEEKIIRIVDKFNNGEIEDLISVFNDVETLLKFFKRKNVIHLVDPFSTDLQDYENEILYFLIKEVGDEQTLKYCVDQLMDITYENGEYYLEVTNRTDLADLFDDRGQDTTARDVVISMFSDDTWEPFWDTTDDVYRDVIEALNPENIEILKQYMLKDLNGVKIEINERTSSLIDELSTNNIFYLIPEYIDEIIKDEDSMRYLLQYELPELRQELKSVHSNAYNSAYETEIYNDIMSELETYFDTKSAKWKSVPSKYNPEKLTEFYSIKFKPGILMDTLLSYLGDKNLWGYYQNNLGYLGNWLLIMDTLMSEGDEPRLDFRIPDYADWTLTRKYVNEILPDHI